MADGEEEMTDSTAPEKSGLPAPVSDRELPFAETTLSLSAQPPVELQPGVVLLDKFKVLELLGVGGMGSVYRVEHLFMNQQYALKCLNKCQRNDINWRRFENEAKAANMLDHANLLRVFEFGLLQGGRPYFLMELVNGVTLADEVKRLGRLPMKRAIKIFIQVAFAIDYAHEHKIIHRDLKPSNIMLEKKEGEDSESVKVVDFGIAKLTGVDEFNQQTLTKTGEIFGSPLYMSPEQCTGTTIDHRSDLYSLGCLFYESLTGAPPFIGDTALATMMKHQGEPPLSLKEASMGIGFPIGLEKIVAKLLEKDPNMRYQHASALAKDLIDLERNLSGETTPSLKKGQLPSDKGKLVSKGSADTSTNTIAVAILAAFIGAIVGGGLCYWALNSQLNELSARYEALKAGQNTFASEAQSEGQAATKSSSSAAPQAGSYSKIVDGQRILKFPAGKTLGSLIDDQGFVIEAQEEKKFPKDKKLLLISRNDTINNPELLAGFAPDDLKAIVFEPQAITKPEGYLSIANLTGLEALNVKHSLFNDTSLAGLEKLTNLQYFNCDDTRVHGTALARSPILKNLKALDVSNNSEMFPFCQILKELDNLAELQMQHCQLDDMLLKSVSECKSLKVLGLSQNRDITDVGITYLLDLKNLAWLDLTRTSVSPNCLATLLAMPALKKVELAELHWTDKQKTDFQKAVRAKKPALKIFWDDQETSDHGQVLPDLKWAGNLK
jgi:serine/threonine protein kinase